MTSLSSRVAAAFLGLLFTCAAYAPGVRAMAAENAETRTLVPVGHTVGVKLFADGVLVVGLSDGDTPAKAARCMMAPAKWDVKERR